MKSDFKSISFNKGLFKDREILENGSVSRGAAVFPIFDLIENDLILIFQNYWKWKRALDVEFSLTVRSKKGVAHIITKNEPVKEINRLSIKEIVLENHLDLNLFNEGLVEIEILSEKNIVYPFPAIIASYLSKNGMVSSVHSCGRTLKEEEKENRFFSETNFYVNKSIKYLPFVHIFNGPSGSISDIKIKIRENSSGKIKKIINIENLENPFESKVIYFNLNDKKNDNCEINHLNESEEISIKNNAKFVVTIEGFCSSIYPRFLCGNYDKKNNHYCVTHTFREVNFSGDTLNDCVDPSQSSYVSLPVIKGLLDLKAIVYPTSSPESVKVKLAETNFSNLDNKISSVTKDLSLNSCEIYTSNLSSKDHPGVLLTAFPDNEKNELPARIGINLMYFLSSGMNTMPPDIAHQMSTYLTKHKLNYWYSGLIISGYKNIILGSSISSYSMIKRKAEIIDFDLSVKLNNGNELNKNYFFNEKHGKSFNIKLDHLFKEYGFNYESASAYSWRITLNKGKMGALYCLSYNPTIGCIYGEHSF